MGVGILDRKLVTEKNKVHTEATETSKDKRHHILKVQKTFDEGFNELSTMLDWKGPNFLDTALTVYSQHQEIYGFISPKNPHYLALKRSIENEGLLRYKIYIRCRLIARSYLSNQRPYSCKEATVL